MAEGGVHRLSKVAKELGVGVGTLVDFLNSGGGKVENNPNAKITDAQYAIVRKEYEGDKKTKDEAKQKQTDREVYSPTPAAIVAEALRKPVAEPKIVVSPPPVVKAPPPPAPAPPPSPQPPPPPPPAPKSVAPEVVQRAKVKLEGPKIIGKIETEPPKKGKPAKGKEKTETPAPKKGEKKETPVEPPVPVVEEKKSSSCS